MAKKGKSKGGRKRGTYAPQLPGANWLDMLFSPFGGVSPATTLGIAAPPAPQTDLSTAWRSFLNSIGMRSTNQGVYGAGVMPQGGYVGSYAPSQNTVAPASGVTTTVAPPVTQKITRDPYNMVSPINYANYGYVPAQQQAYTPYAVTNQIAPLQYLSRYGGQTQGAAQGGIGAPVPTGWVPEQGPFGNRWWEPSYNRSLGAWQNPNDRYSFGGWRYDPTTGGYKFSTTGTERNVYGQPAGTPAPIVKRGGRAGGGMGYAVKQGPTVKPPPGWNPKKKGGGGNYPTTSTGLPPVGAAWGNANWRP